MALDQVARYFGNDAEEARRSVRRLKGRGLIDSRRALVQRPRRVRPIFQSLEDGPVEQEKYALEWQAEKKGKLEYVEETVFFATALGYRRPAQTSHDLGVADVFLAKGRPEAWRGEEWLRQTVGCRDGEKIFDAALVDGSTLILSIDYLTQSYRAQRIVDIVRSSSVPVELW